MCIAHLHLLPDQDAARVEAALVDVGWPARISTLVIVDATEYGAHYPSKAYPFDLHDQFRFVSELAMRGKHALRFKGWVEIAALSVLVPFGAPG